MVLLTDSQPPVAKPGPRAGLYARWRQERQRAEQMRSLAQWAQAELENLRKQGERERTQTEDRAAAGVVQGLLPVLDALDEASKGGDAPEGVALLRRELEKALAAQGLLPMLVAGQPFDALRHEAVLRDEEPCKPGEAPGLWVAEELRKGWLFRGRVLRPAMVRVVERTRPEPPSKSQPSEE